MKYLELFKNGFDSTIDEKIKPENWPYVGYSPSEGFVFTADGPDDNEIWYKIDSNENIQIFVKLNTEVSEIFYDDDKKYNIIRTLDPITEIKGQATGESAHGMVYSYYSFGHRFMYDSYSFPPESMTYYPVKEVWLPDCIKTLGFYAFYGCKDVLKINLPKSIEYIQQSAFNDHHLISNDNYKYIEDCIISGTTEFKNNQFTEIEIGKSFRLIGETAFYNSKFEKVTVSDSVRHINGGVFGRCQNLTSIKLPANSILTGESVENGHGDYLYPSVGTFEYCPSLQGVHLPVNITSITNRTFFSCTSLTTIEYAGTKAQWEMIPKDSKWFYNNDSFNQHNNYLIETVNCTDGVLITSSKIEYTSTNGQIISGFYLDGNVISNTYEDGKGKLVLDRVITTIEGAPFAGCSIASITIPNSVTSIEDYAFGGCYELTSITIPNSVTSLGSGIFHECFSLTSIVVESGHTIYDSRENCNAIIETATNTLIAGCQTTVIPNSVTCIGGGAFEGCTPLTSITIPISATHIGDRAFTECYSLAAITFEGTIEEWNTIVKGENWHLNVPATYVQCSNGQVTL